MKPLVRSNVDLSLTFKCGSVRLRSPGKICSPVWSLNNKPCRALYLFTVWQKVMIDISYRFLFVSYVFNLTNVLRKHNIYLSRLKLANLVSQR
jgi:hypothetical protein